MGLFDFLKKSTSTADLDIAVKTHPLTSNPTNEEIIARTRQRLARCQQAFDEASDPAYKTQLAAAIEKHKAALIIAGVKE